MGDLYLIIIALIVTGGLELFERYIRGLFPFDGGGG